ncbi:cobyrinate a,c-diamide synthase [Peptacetobacter sp.]|uniref:cobyrinate a,c-diamide synthase n=1 Tax=Peptacetobacter sp. TaxID=2991975 RepID=UPI00260F3CC8|nr:cobyrinate a,c-diamide synthase [Peptacetobacter sp.]
MKKIMIAGTSSGVGKTTISLGIMRALTKRNLKVQPYKIGPDYIDPSFHTFITGRESRNLDSYMLDDEKIKSIVKTASCDADISVIEGVMGLYDGFGIDINNCSSSYTSKITKTPVILVINGKAMAASSAATVLGYLNLDKDVNIIGVIANNVRTESHFKIIKESIKKYCNIEVLGYFPPNEKFALESRHLGLIPMDEVEKLSEKFSSLAEEIEKYIDIDRIIKLSESEDIESKFNLEEELKKRNLYSLAKGRKVSIAYDKAFNFYYRENIEIFEKLGIEIKYFSPLNDESVPDSDFVYIGGGFPEIFAKELENNKKIRENIFGLYEKNIPIYAECGGLMYLGKSIIDKNGEKRDMVGVFDGESEMTPKLKRFGYCEGEALYDTVISKKGDFIKGHEFHHSIFKSEENCAYKMKKIRDKEVIDEWVGGYSKKNTLATYLHTHFYNNLDCIENILQNCIKVRKEI